MKIKGISAGTVAFLLELGRIKHPKEFLILLGADNGVITRNDFILLPGTIEGYHSASFPLDMVPLNLGHIGSAHSHPNGVISPSDADISFFSSTGSCHFIVGYPYEEGCWGCFNVDGTRRELAVIDDE
jgi:proteasome lid subunit RPN8/RPN11